MGESCCGVIGLCTLGLDWEEWGVCLHWVCLCISIGSTGLGGPSVLGMCIFFNRFYCFGVVGLCTLGVD